MNAKRLLVVLASGLLLLAAGCGRIQEPWVRSPDQLRQERSRTAPQQTALRHRLLAVQTDR